jgi:hypothetical protein
LCRDVSISEPGAALGNGKHAAIDMDGADDSEHTNGHADGQQPNGHAKQHDQDGDSAEADDVEGGEESGKAAASRAKLNTGSANKSTLPFEQL